MNFNLSSGRVHLLHSNPRYRLLLLLGGLLLTLLACGLFTPQYQLNNQVRLAVYNYERAQRGPVNELVIAFNRNEPRLKFEGQNENGGRTVWLYDLAAREYFAERSPDSTFMYIQKIEYFDNYRRAIVTVYRGDGQGYIGRELTLQQDNPSDPWQIVAEQLLDAP